jgi:hypothetical protein
MVAGATATMTPEQLPVTQPVYFAAGVADPDQRAAYVADGDGTVAVRLSDGRELWRTDRAQWPLISDGERLAAASLQAGPPSSFAVVVLDAQRAGEPMLVSDPILLPEWVTVAVERRAGLWLRAERQKGLLRLEWEARARYGGGAAPPAHISRAATRDAAGVAQVDLESGAGEPLSIEEEEEASARGAVRRPPLASDDLAEAWRAGTTVARLIWDIDDSGQVLSLETGDASSDESGVVVELARGQGLVAQVTPDGCHLLVHQEPAGVASHEWRVFSATTGRAVATLTYDAGASSPAILGDRVFYLVERRGDSVLTRALRARELASGAVVWELVLRERGTSAAPRLRQ